MIYGILFFVSVTFIFFFSTTTSPFYEHCQFWFLGDSGIFQEMGICLLQGGTPYVDLFDHKGPVLWFIQAFGLGINRKWGLMLFQCISLFYTSLIWYKTNTLLYGKKTISIIITIIGLLFLIAVYEHGNLCEEYSLPFISLPVYFYLKRWKTEPNSKRPIYNHTDTFIMGLCVGIIAMIRINNTAPIIGFALWHFIRCVQQKEHKRMWTDVALICGGIAIIFAICSTFYLIKAGWSGVYEMTYGTFIFNYKYYKSGQSPDALFAHNYVIPIVFFITTLFCLFNKNEKPNLNIPLSLSYLITIVAIGSYGFGHYMMLFILLYILSLYQITLTGKKWMYIIPFILLLYSVRLSHTAADLLLFKLRGKHSHTELIDGFHQFISSMSPNERSSIYKTETSYMVSTLFANENICQCNRFIYNNHIKLSPRFQKYAKTHGIKDLQPVWVLTQSQQPKAIDEYMRTHYTLADSIPGGEHDPIWGWKRTNLLDY